MTDHITGPPGVKIAIEGEGEYRRGRLPSDVLRLVVAALVGVIGLLLASILDDISVGITIEVIEAFDGLPNAFVVTFILAMQMVAWVLPVAALFLLLLWQRYRRLGLVVLSAFSAVVIAFALQSEVTARFAPPELEVATPSWVCVDGGGVGVDDPEAVGDLVREPGGVLGGILETGACVPGDGFPSIVYLAGLVAGFSTLTPWLVRRWRLAAWLTLAAFLVTRLIDGALVPIDALLITALAYVIGAAVLLVFGAPDRHPGGADVAIALRRGGFDVRSLSLAATAEPDRRFLVAELSGGERVFVKVRTAEERSAEILYRLYRMVRLRGFGDERPSVSLRREVEHEAAVSMAATANGVRSPQLRRVLDVAPDAMIFVFDHVAGATLAELAGDDLEDATLRSMWSQLGRLHSAQIAHRNLSLGNVLVDEHGEALLVDFGFGEMSAAESDMAGDVAQLLASTSPIVGAERAVEVAVAALGREVVAAAGPRLQAAALSTTTLAALKKHKGLIEDLRRELLEATGTEPFELEKLERVNARSVLMIVTLGLAFYFLIPQLAEVRFEDLVRASWEWFLLVIFFSFMTYVGATVALMGALPVRLRFRRTLMAQIAASFFNRIMPVKVGGIAANIRYLQTAGIDPPVAVAGVGLNNLAGVAVHVSLLVIFVTTAGRSASDAISFPETSTVALILAIVLGVAGVVMLLPFGRRLWLRRIWPILRKSGAGLAQVATNPLKMAMLFGGAVVITMSYAFALWYSIAAFGGGLGFVATTAVYLGGQAIAQAAPTPGGVGAAEAALIAGLTAFGLEAAVAVPAVFLYRVGTFWLPIVPGYLSYRRLEKLGAL